MCHRVWADLSHLVVAFTRVLNMRTYVSTINFGSGTLSEVLRHLGAPSYPAVEISSGHAVDDDSWESVLDYARRHEASVLLHNFAPPEPGRLLINLAVADPSIRKELVSQIPYRHDK